MMPVPLPLLGLVDCLLLALLSSSFDPLACKLRLLDPASVDQFSALLIVFCSYVLVLEAGGGELAVAATAAALALADAGIELFDLVTACSVVRLYSEGTLLTSAARHAAAGPLLDIIFCICIAAMRRLQLGISLCSFAQSRAEGALLPPCCA